MILTKLSLENFGLFRDKYTFDLTTRSESKVRPIILFGGKNGAGKTTLFEAFKLCLYGSALPEFSTKKSEYEDYIKGKIHRFPRLIIQPMSAVIAVEFEYARLGRVDKYNIERRWHLMPDKKNISEDFEILINGKPFEELDNSQWQDFIKELIPIGVAKLFFFDGEQIQALAEDNTDELRLKDSFYSLLGLDLVERLQSDLHIHLTRKAKESDETYGRELDRLDNENRQINEQIDEVKQKRGDLENKINNRRKRALEMQDKLSLEGGEFAKKRDELNKKKAHLDIEIDQIYEQIRNLCSDLLPFAFVPQYCVDLRKRLTEEEKVRSESLVAREVKKALDIVENEVLFKIKKLGAGLDKKLNEELITELRNSFRNALLNNYPSAIKEGNGDKNNNNNHNGDNEINNHNDDYENNNVKLIHHLSSFEQNKILGWIDVVLNDIPRRIKTLNDNLEKLTIELQKTEDALKKAPSDEVIAPLINELNTVNQEIGNGEILVKQSDEKISQLQFRLMHVNAQTKQLELAKRGYEKVHRGIELAHKVQDALQDYEAQLKEDKLKQLSQSLLDCLNELMHKEIFHKVFIEPESFAVTLYDKEGKAMPKKQLSAGEKQIYAIAILWALARTSGRPLPFIVDTPLGRLDSDHRLNLVQNFFPVASHQVMIFSTDTEIDQKYFEDLSEHISKSYKLEYNNNEGRTNVEPGYFWRLNKKEDGQYEKQQQEQMATSK